MGTLMVQRSIKLQMYFFILAGQLRDYEWRLDAEAEKLAKVTEKLKSHKKDMKQRPPSRAGSKMSAKNSKMARPTSKLRESGSIGRCQSRSHESAELTPQGSIQGSFPPKKTVRLPPLRYTTGKLGAAMTPVDEYG